VSLAEKVTWPSGGKQESTPTKMRLRKMRRRRRRKSKLNLLSEREKTEGKCATGQTQVFIGNSPLSEDLFFLFLENKRDITFC